MACRSLGEDIIAYFSPPRTVAFSPPTLSAASPTAVSAEPRFRGPETQPLIPGQVPEAEHAFWKIPGMEVGVARREGHAEVKPACQAGVPPVDPHTVAWHRLWARRGRPESWNLKELTPPELTLQWGGGEEVEEGGAGALEAAGWVRAGCGRERAQLGPPRRLPARLSLPWPVMDAQLTGLRFCRRREGDRKSAGLFQPAVPGPPGHAASRPWLSAQPPQAPADNPRANGVALPGARTAVPPTARGGHGLQMDTAAASALLRELPGRRRLQGSQFGEETPLSGTSLGGTGSQGPSRPPAVLPFSAGRRARGAPRAKSPRASRSRARRRPAPQCHPPSRTAEATPRGETTLRAAAGGPPASGPPSRPQAQACPKPPCRARTPGAPAPPRTARPASPLGQTRAARVSAHRHWPEPAAQTKGAAAAGGDWAAAEGGEARRPEVGGGAAGGGARGEDSRAEAGRGRGRGGVPWRAAAAGRGEPARPSAPLPLRPSAQHPSRPGAPAGTAAAAASSSSPRAPRPSPELGGERGNGGTRSPGPEGCARAGGATYGESPCPAAGGAAPRPRRPVPGLQGRGELPRGRRPGSWMLRRDWKLLALPEDLTRRGASPGREGRAAGRPAGRGVASGGPLASGGPARPPSERRQLHIVPSRGYRAAERGPDDRKSPSARQSAQFRFPPSGDGDEGFPAPSLRAARLAPASPAWQRVGGDAACARRRDPLGGRGSHPNQWRKLSRPGELGAAPRGLWKRRNSQHRLRSLGPPEHPGGPEVCQDSGSAQDPPRDPGDRELRGLATACETPALRDDRRSRTRCALQPGPRAARGEWAPAPRTFQAQPAPRRL
ncbi:collagen alpha-1(I) chain [Mustela lutreola]|uniref:collagen alpha-1(I) chain n=1 Tax=Mustela lutreola TaxID=9666 RepID=UPI00279743C3|nr:collagen alpha-1(I) chain [Mustela lutreola]